MVGCGCSILARVVSHYTHKLYILLRGGGGGGGGKLGIEAMVIMVGEGTNKISPQWT